MIFLFCFFSIIQIYALDITRYGSEEVCPDLTKPQKTSTGIAKLCGNDDDCDQGYNCLITTHSHFGTILKYCCQSRETICSLPPNPGYGDCLAQPKTKFYFDILELRCKTFQYIDCHGGNQNQFDTIQECSRYCQSTACGRGETLLLSPTNTPVTCANSNVCPDGHRCVYDQLFRRHVCCGMTRQDVCPLSSLSYANPPSFKPLACQHSQISDECPADFLCTGQSKKGYCCTPQYGVCPLGQKPYLHPITKRSMKCDPMRIYPDCPNDYHCSSAVPGASWGFCCSTTTIAECPEGSQAFLDTISRQPQKCTVGVSVCSIGYTCQSINKNIIGFCCTKLVKSNVAHSPAIKELSYQQVAFSPPKKERKEPTKKVDLYSSFLNNLNCPKSGKPVYYEGTQLVRECTPVPGLSNECPDNSECVAANHDIYGRSVCCILPITTTLAPRILVPQTTQAIIFMVTSKVVPAKTQTSTDPFCPTVIVDKKCKSGRTSYLDCQEVGFFCQYNIELREYRCCSMEIEGAF